MIALAFAFERPDGTWGAVTDDTGRLIATQIDLLAAVFVARLLILNVQVHVTRVTPTEVAALLASAGYGADDIDHKFALIEGQAENVSDAITWAWDLAERIPTETPTEAACRS